MSDIIFHDGYALELDATEKNTYYQFITDEGKKGKRFPSKDDPRSLGKTSKPGKEIWNHIQEPGIDVEKKFEQILILIGDLREEILDAKNQCVEDVENMAESVRNDRIAEGYDELGCTDNPLLWIANEMDWFGADERLNIMYAWLAFCSQVILKEPISVIGIGEGGSGKTHVIEAGLSNIPEEFIIVIKQATEAALLAFADEDPYYFDGKIVNIGDMGGRDDHDEAQNFKNAMKELQTDAYYSRIKQVPDHENQYVNKLYELHGKPCITYTNVPGHDYDDQEISRSLFIKPQTNNDREVEIFKQLHRQKNTLFSRQIEEHEESKRIIQNMVYALRDRMHDVSIYNPFGGFMSNFLAGSAYKKRDTDKFDGILRVITAINGYDRPIFEYQGGKVLFTTVEDIKIFIDILQKYWQSIISNLTPGAIDLYEVIEDTYNGLEDVEFTVQKVVKLPGHSLKKRAVQKYMSELNGAGVLSVLSSGQGVAATYKFETTLRGTNEIKNIELNWMDKIAMTGYGIDEDDSEFYNSLFTTYDIPITSQLDVPPMWSKGAHNRAPSKSESGKMDDMKKTGQECLV